MICGRRVILTAPTVRLEPFDWLLGQALRTGQGRETGGSKRLQRVSTTLDTNGRVISPSSSEEGLGWWRCASIARVSEKR